MLGEEFTGFCCPLRLSHVQVASIAASIWDFALDLEYNGGTVLDHWKLRARALIDGELEGWLLHAMPYALAMTWKVCIRCAVCAGCCLWHKVGIIRSMPIATVSDHSPGPAWQLGSGLAGWQVDYASFSPRPFHNLAVQLVRFTGAHSSLQLTAAMGGIAGWLACR
jgi:hypothetical protein